MAVNNIEVGSGNSGLYENIRNVYSSSVSANVIPFSFLSNITGYAGSLPVSAVDAEGITGPKLFLSSLKGFQYNQEDSAYELRRYMQDLSNQTSNYSNPSNTWFCAVPGTYSIYSWSDNNLIRVNGSQQGSSFDTMDLKDITLSVGDRVEGKKPFSFGLKNTPGITGGYGGYCGYSFATRNDRQNGANTNKIFGFPLDNSPTQIGSTAPGQCLIGYTTVNNGLVTSNLTTVYRTFTNTGQSATHISADLAITRNYYAQSNILQCMWKGRPTTPSFDTVSIMPLTTETKYGWFSQGGHILAMGGAYQRREYPTPGITENRLYTRTGAQGGGGTSYNEFGNPTNVGEFVYTDTPSASSTSKMQGSPVAVYIDPGVGNSDDGRGMIFTAESQADGNGSEMTSFVTERCMSKFTMIPTGYAYAVFLTTFYNSSINAALVTRYTWNVSNSQWEFNESKVLGNSVDGWANNATPYKFSSCRFSNAGTTQQAFKIIFPFATTNTGAACWADIELNDADETNIIMGDDMDSFQLASFVASGDESEEGGGSRSAGDACLNADFNFTLYSNRLNTLDPIVGQVFCTDSSADVGFSEREEVSTANKWYRLTVTRTNYAIQFDSPGSGRVKAVVVC